MDSIASLLLEMEEYAQINRVPIIGQAGAALLAEVVSKKQPLLVLEVGTAIGYSAIVIAANAPGARIITIEKDSKRIMDAREFISRAGLQDRIQIFCGDAGELIPTLSGTFDFVFIDAAKGQYLDYLQKVLDKLNPGAVVAADNVCFRGLVMHPEDSPRRFRTIVKRLNQYLEFVSGNPQFATNIYPDGDGLAISYYKGDAK